MSSSAPTPTPKRVAIIGTACRGPDRGKIDGKLFATLQEFAAFMIRDVWQLSSVVLVSGGAPGADHLAVRLFASGAYEGLRLHLPARWSGSAFNNRDRDGFKINLLHAQFAHDTGIGSLRELGRAIKGGAECVASPDGFLARNVSLAQDCDYMLAFGWDEGLEPTRRGGTAYTWRRAPARVVKKYMDINGWLPRGPVPEEPPRTVRGQRSLGECKAWEVPKTIKKRPARAAPPPAPRPRGFSVVAGDLFRAPVEASLGHCVSRDLVMGAGIAVEFKRRFGRVAQLRGARRAVTTHESDLFSLLQTNTPRSAAWPSCTTRGASYSTSSPRSATTTCPRPRRSAAAWKPCASSPSSTACATSASRASAAVATACGGRRSRRSWGTSSRARPSKSRSTTTASSRAECSVLMRFSYLA